MDAIKKASAFKHEIKRTLESLESLVKEFDRYNGEFDQPLEEAGYLIRKMEEAKELVVECLKVRKFNYVYRAVCVPSSVPENPVGLDVPLKGLKMELFKDGVSVLILSAPPGCGKTSLAALLYYDEEVKERLQDNIFFITVSQKPNLQLIVQRIFQHKNYEIPAFLGDHALDDMVAQLRIFVEYMYPKPLFILDDVCPQSEFVLNKLDFRIPGYKVLATSRDKLPKYGSTFKLNPLDEKDAMILFRRLASQSPDVPEEVLNNIVKASKGFPIALITDALRVNRALCVPSSVLENPVGPDVPLKGLKMDMQGLPPLAFIDLPGDTSPLPSPPRKCPRTANFRSPTGPPPHNNAEFSARETNASLEVHPLPLLPAPTVLSPASTPQGIAKSESTPLKSQWQKRKFIGRGTFGSVYLASNRVSGAFCAMKEVEIFPDDLKSADCVKQLEQEIKVLSHLEHQNIVQYYGSEIVEDHFYICIEFVYPGSLNRYIRKHCGSMTEDVLRHFTRHIVSGLAYLHSNKTVHRDIKGANLLVDTFGVVKLADFGMAKHLSGHSAILSMKGSPYWMAPELLQSEMQKDNSSDVALAVDIWSLGCTIIEMFTGKPPWSEYEPAAAMFKALTDTPPIPESLSPEGQDFLRCCLRRNPAERSTANVLLEHKWLKNL